MRMYCGNDFAARWFRVGLASAWIAVTGISLAAQSQRKTPAKPQATSAPQEKEDPLAPLLQQANEAIDKMDFAAALDPLQKYIAQRPDEAYPHFQLGFAYVGLKRTEDAKSEFSRAIALDPKMAAAHLNLGLVLMDSDPAAACPPHAPGWRRRRRSDGDSDRSSEPPTAHARSSACRGPGVSSDP